jgi:uncharacterized protein YndB with AHSA1/START domain
MRMTGALETIDGRRALRFERYLPHSSERVWRAVTEPAELSAWFVATPPWTPLPGETFEAHGQSGRVTALDAPRTIAWEWGRERYSFEIRPESDGCRLTFVHWFDESMGPGGQHASGWEAYLNRLDALLEGRELSEAEAHRVVPELSERYAIAFGEDAAPARESFARYGPLPLTLDDGPGLRFEWRFGYPIERVWRAISEPAERAQWFPSDARFEVIDSEPPRLLTGDFWGDRLRFELRPDGDGCVLLFTHEFSERDDAAKTAAGWDRCFTRLHALLAGVPLGEEEALELWPLVHERYAEAFGVDPAIGREAYAQHPAT